MRIHFNPLPIQIMIYTKWVTPKVELNIPAIGLEIWSESKTFTGWAFMKFRYWIILSIAGFIFFIAPYLVAGTTQDSYFGGFLINPLDGNSYLAKIRLGVDGEWKFRLPFTTNPGEGAYLFTYYLFLGHIARLLNLTPLLVFHVARLLSAIILVWTLWKFIGYQMEDSTPATKRWTLAWCIFGGGLGWMLFPFGIILSDTWVAEAFPFLSMYSSPHFSMGMSLLLWMLVLADSEKLRARLLFSALGLALAIIMPFGLVIAGIILALRIIISWVMKTKREVFVLLLKLIPGGAILLYQLIVSATDPVLKIWNEQNQTPSPPVWDLILSLSPAIILAIFSAVRLLRNKQVSDRRLPLIIWIIGGFALIYLPLDLQRRFMFAYFVPCVLLAGWWIGNRASTFRRKWIWLIIIVFSSLSSVMTIVFGIYGVQTRNPNFYLTNAEMSALNWVSENTPPGSVILCSPEMGMFLPGYTGRRVVYGHPFETANADQEIAFVNEFFKTSASIHSDLLSVRGVDFVLYGKREAILAGETVIQDNCLIAYNNEEITICAINAEKKK